MKWWGKEFGLDVGCGAGLSTKAEETSVPVVPYDIITAAGVINWVDKDAFLYNAGAL